MMSSWLTKYVIDLTLWGLATLLAYAFRKPNLLAVGLAPSVWVYLLLSLLVMSAVAWRHHLPQQTWHRAGILDLRALTTAVAVTTLVMFALGFALQEWLQLPRSVPLLAGVMGLMLMGAARLGARLVYEQNMRNQTESHRRVLIVGAGDAGTLIAREMQRHPESGLNPVGFLDDEGSKQKQRLVGLPVFGRVADLVAVAEREQIQEVLIAVPSAPGEFVRQVVELADKAHVRYRIMPGLFEILSGDVSISQIREVNLEDLLRRPPVVLNTAEIADYLKGRVVLVTGAGGSIGSEIVRQVARFAPAQIVLFGRGENSIFSIQQELARHMPDVPQLALIGDVRDAERVRAVFESCRPDVVFHAAAHKHVPLMEQTPSEAILNNVLGTRNVVACALTYGVRRLVNISTDKAVNPTSVMGASKRLAEMVISAAAKKAAPDQAFVSVRFGNVLGSRGSVVPTFMAQIRQGGPITVTHPEMVRYFMTIPEAARLVLQAGGLAENGKVYVLNMGDPVKISDLAHDVIRLSGARDVEIKYTGVRPGEKLYEELLTNGEGTSATTHQEIFSANLADVDANELVQAVETLVSHARHNDAIAIRTDLATLIPENKFGVLK